MAFVGEDHERRVAQHVMAFNDAVRSGEWPFFAERFTDDATMRFVGVPIGPFKGRDAITAAYLSQPPTATLTVQRVRSDDDSDLIWFRWDDGGTGSMTIRWRSHLIAELSVAFDD